MDVPIATCVLNSLYLLIAKVFAMLSQRLENKVALITGGGTGIGAATAERFVKAGANVVITGRRLNVLQTLAEKIGCLTIPCDVSSMEDCEKAVAETINHFGQLDIVVANAGVIYEGNAWQQSLSEWHNSFNTNVTGSMQIARAAIPHLKKQQGSAIVNISSVAGLTSGSGVASYVASKTALLGLTRSLAIDCGPLGIRVNTLCPGWVQTPMSEEEMQTLANMKNISVDQAVKSTVQHLPLARMAVPDEIAACVEFLVSDEASFITGTTLVADGGGSCVDVGTLSFNE
jgi:NAD(P)-dependent dehydrogenase (short-subunit alcohol dehydrogenase family)